MNHFVYILYSQGTGGYYIGETAYPEERLAEHNEGKYNGSYRVG